MLRTVSTPPILLLLTCLSVSSPAEAQFMSRLTNPQVAVSLTHPPGLGLSVQRVAFGPARGECADELVSGLIEDFVGQGVEVIDRQHLQAILEEHDFTLSGYVDSSSAAALGQILGPSALVLADVTRCATEKKRTYDRYVVQGVTRYTYYATTTSYFRASVQVVDLATARIFTAKTVESTPQLQNKSNEGYPEYPSEYTVRDLALGSARTEIFRLFFTWNEIRDLYFFNDDKCNLKAAYQLLKIGDLEGAAQLSEENLETCKADQSVKPKNLAHAYYNVGMARFIGNDHEGALEYLQQAHRTKPGSIIEETILECRRAKQLAAELQRLEEAPVAIAEMGPEPGLQMASKELVDKEQPPEESSFEDLEERLRNLEKLHDKGLLTDEEYAQKKQEILEAL